MKMTRFLPLALAAVAAFGQTTPRFEVASIRPSAPLDERANVGVHIDGAMIRCSYLTLKDYVRMAYNLKLYQIQGPEWLGSEHFDISAKLPEGARRDQLGEMLQDLLADRFQLKVHHDSKEFPVYALVAGKNGPKIKESALETGDGAEGGAGAVNVTASGGREGVSVNLGRGASFTFANNRLEVKKADIPGFAESLARFVDRPVVDMTGLKARYDFGFDLAPEDYQAMLIRSAINAGVVLPPEARMFADNASNESLFAGFESLGLKLERRKAPLQVLVVDHAEKTPAAN